MLNDKQIADLMDIKEAPSNLSQDAIRNLYNENFRKVRALLDQMYKDSQNNNNIVQNLNIVFPSSPDTRLQYVMKYNPELQKWVVAEFLGTQNVFENGDAVKVGSKHQHIVNESLQIGIGGEIIVDAGGEIVVNDSSSNIVLPYEIQDPLEEKSLPYDYLYVGINSSETSNIVSVTKNGSDVVNSGDTILSTDYITFSTGETSDLGKKIYFSLTKL